MVADFGRGFVLYPVSDIVDFEMPYETGKAGAELFGGWIEPYQAIRPSPSSVTCKEMPLVAMSYSLLFMTSTLSLLWRRLLK